MGHPAHGQEADDSNPGVTAADGGSAARQPANGNGTHDSVSTSNSDNWQTRPPDSPVNGPYASTNGKNGAGAPASPESDNQSKSAAANVNPSGNLDDRGDVAARFQDADLADDAEQRPRVAAEDDDYSLNDQSLGDVTAVGLDELSKLFEVKKVESFKADDPKNPKNIKPVNNHPEEERR
ncbi:hypothetical protein OZX74_07440 [Bifidobacterium sp. ESL0798]|nr:hypothetical protein [Bifidobacterium sp. ESL0798]WEV73723.1 hypothetical protein OZX74_07440 [Bifidobacterium sp. ESL0798]